MLDTQTGNHRLGEQFRNFVTEQGLTKVSNVTIAIDTPMGSENHIAYSGQHICASLSSMLDHFVEMQKRITIFLRGQ